MLRYMLDTNILIYTVKNKPEMVRIQFEAHDGEICASSITAMELLYGAHKSQAVRRNLDVIEALIGPLRFWTSTSALLNMPGRSVPSLLRLDIRLDLSMS